MASGRIPVAVQADEFHILFERVFVLCNRLEAIERIIGILDEQDIPDSLVRELQPKSQCCLVVFKTNSRIGSVEAILTLARIHTCCHHQKIAVHELSARRIAELNGSSVLSRRRRPTCHSQRSETPQPQVTAMPFASRA